MSWGESLTKLDQDPEVAPVHLPRLIDDPVSTLEQIVIDLRIAQEAREVSGVLKQIGLFVYYSMLMATAMRLRPYLSSTFLWVHEWQLSKIYDDFAPAESAFEMLKDVTMKEVKGGYVVLSNQTLKVLGDFALDDKADVGPCGEPLGYGSFSVEYAVLRSADQAASRKGHCGSGDRGDPRVFSDNFYLVTVRGPLL